MQEINFYFYFNKFLIILQANNINDSKISVGCNKL